MAYSSPLLLGATEEDTQNEDGNRASSQDAVLILEFNSG
jgi:hypothetical protein